MTPTATRRPGTPEACPAPAAPTLKPHARLPAARGEPARSPTLIPGAHTPDPRNPDTRNSGPRNPGTRPAARGSDARPARRRPDDAVERLRRRDSLPILPETLAAVAALAGEGAALALARGFGGGRVRFARRPRAGNALVALLGEETYALLRDRLFGDATVEVPAARGYLALLEARRLKARGLPLREIAARTGIALSTARRYTAGTAPCGGPAASAGPVSCAGAVPHAGTAPHAGKAPQAGPVPGGGAAP
ncbi:MAG TPA: helix-turn-helix domain-containing protein [Azospirillaceae bacterium]|nr:helix-turn-helix domain-containing protein [Azospirillaceae bacterium]